jgi:three-Cys-motif partner protein
VAKALKRPRYPIWTENKAKLIERYLYYFVQVTKHGTYIDAFAGPQDVEKYQMWAAKLVVESEPRWFRHFHLFELDPGKVKQLEELRDSQAPRRRKEPKRTIAIYPGDCNTNIPGFLSRRTITEKESTFCLLDQRTFECEWSTVQALAQYKSSGYKIELFYFLANGWIDRSIAAQKDHSVLDRWWGRADWKILRDVKAIGRAQLVADRFKNELGYAFASYFPIRERSDGGKVMYYMVHATDHPAASELMSRAYRNAVVPKEHDQLALTGVSSTKVR